MSGSSSPIQSKVIDAEQLADALRPEASDTQALIEELIAPTADDLLALTMAAVEDIEGTLPLTPEQLDALAVALRHRLLGAVMPAADDEESGS
ncbi:MAG: hypothetical protein ACFB01_01485 [Cohaesibacteraceae bacterium]